MSDDSRTSLANLEMEFVRLGDELSVIANRRQALDAEIRKRKQAAAAVVRLGALSGLERDALRRELEK